MNNELTQNNFILRPADDADWENYVRHLSETDEFYVQYGMEPTPELIEMIRNMNPDVIYYSIILKDTGDMAGYVGITPDNNNLEFYLFKEHRKKSYGSSAVKAFCEMYLSGEITGKPEKEIIAETLFDNEPSSRFVEKIGFEREAMGFRVDFNKEDIPSTLLCMYVYRNEKEIK